MSDQVIVNENQCRLIAARLKPLTFRPHLFQRPYLTFSSDLETKLRVWLFSAAICHQTHTLINRTKNLVGWDYLEEVFTTLGKENSPLIDPKYLVTLSIPELEQKIKPLFADDGNPDHCTLDRLEQRAQFMIEISQQLVEDYNGKVENLLKSSNGFLFNHGQGLYELLEKFPAFADPLRKKSTVFIKWILDTNAYQFKDENKLIPVMDYHMQRVLLRTGCLEVLDSSLKEALLHKKQLSSDQEIRVAAVQAIQSIANYSDKDPVTIHDFFWPLGRSCCKEETLCQYNVCDKKPCTFFLFVEIPEHQHCIFENVCKGHHDENYRRFWQPLVETHYY